MARDTGIFDQAYEYVVANPAAGLIGGGGLALMASGFKWVWPATFQPGTGLIVFSLSIIAAVGAIGGLRGLFNMIVDQRQKNR